MYSLPSLNFPSPMGGSSRTRSSYRGRGGKGRGRYSALELNDMDEIPLDMDEGPLINGRDVPSDEEDEEVEQRTEGVVWERLGGRKRWHQRMRSHSTLLGLICGGGWQVVLSK